MKIIEAKYAGTCKVCGQRFAQGSKIAWEPGASRHEACAKGEAAPAVAPSAGRAVSSGRHVRRGWRPCGYPGCSPQYCDECDGDGYRAGR